MTGENQSLEFFWISIENEKISNNFVQNPYEFRTLKKVLENLRIPPSTLDILILIKKRAARNAFLRVMTQWFDLGDSRDSRDVFFLPRVE